MSPALARIFRTASAIWSMSLRGPRNMNWKSHTEPLQSVSFSGSSQRWAQALMASRVYTRRRPPTVNAPGTNVRQSVGV